MSSTSKIGGFKSQMGKSAMIDDQQDEDEVYGEDKSNIPHGKINETKVGHALKAE